MILITAVLFAGFGAYLKYDLLVPFGLYEEEPVIKVPFMLLSDKPAQAELLASRNPTEPTEPPTEAPTEEQTEHSTEVATEAITEPPTEAPTEAPTEPIVVDESWFDDAIFIGDSRSQPMTAYAKLGNAHYFGDAGVSVFNVRFKKCYIEGYSKILLPDLLSQHKYGKVYIMLGINGLYESHERILEEYQVLIDLIRETQPDAAIIINSIMMVGKYRSTTEKYYSLDNIYSLNEKLAELAVGDNMFYIDINELFADEEGYLPKEMSKDGIHLYSRYYKDWANWLIEKAQTFGIR